MKILTNILCGAVALLALAASSSPAYAAAAGTGASNAGQIQFVAGSAQLTSESGKTHLLKKGDAVNEGDTLTTAPAAAVQVRMRDGGIVALRQDSKVKIDGFKFNGKEDGSERTAFSLVKGGFRAITGLIGRVNKQNYRVATPTATIGIRGTDHEIVVIEPGNKLAPPGTYNKVNKGETVMTNGQGEIAILPNQMGFAGAGQAPQLQPLNLNIFTVPPAPQAGSGSQGENPRDHAVVDGALQDQHQVPGFMLPPMVTFTRTPITTTYVCGMNANGSPIYCTSNF
jgi:hypothetical protein